MHAIVLDREAGHGGPAATAVNPAMTALRTRLAQVARTRATVLILGETGAGKEVAARQIHALSGRRGAFVALNCAALPDGLLEAELFGSERGSYTGADTQRLGRIREADGGTLLLDEIGDFSLALQAKILRALESREVRPLGGASDRLVDVRFLAATHRDLRADVAAGRFRSDLYHRLNVVTLCIPPLRQRREELAGLIEQWLPRLATEHGCPVPTLEPSAHAALAAHTWPGNVRELRNVLERLVVFQQRSGRVDADAVEAALGSDAPLALSEAGPGRPVAARPRPPSREEIDAAWVAAEHCVSAAARRLGLSRQALYRRAQALGMSLVPGGAGQ